MTPRERRRKKKSGRAALTALERLRDTYESGRVEAKLALLGTLARASLRSAREVERLHEALCFLRAYPDDARVLAAVERMLARFDRRGDLRRHRDALADTGIAGTGIRYCFFWPALAWLVRRWPDRVELVRSDDDARAKIGAALPLLVTPGEAAWLKEAELPAWAALDRLRSRGETDAAFFARRVGAMPGDSFTREAFHDAIEPSYALRPGPLTPSRTRAKVPWATIAFQRGPLRRMRPDLRAEARRSPGDVRAAAPRAGAALIELARCAMVTRARDLDAFAYGDPHDVRIVDDGDGLWFTLNGVVHERRALLPATYGGLVLRNGVPVGYVQADVAGRSAALSYNTFETFRGGESAFNFARMLAMLRHVLGVESFSLEPYQLGHGNDEAIASGAWWFYYKLGFRPRAAAARRIARAEVAHMKARRGHRTTAATLKQLARWHLFFDLDRLRPAGLPPIAAHGRRVGEFLARRADGDRERALDACARELGRLTGLHSQRGFTPGERLAWRRWSPLVLSIPGVTNWSALDRSALARVVRAKGGRRESDYLRLFAAHPRLARALLRE